MYRRNSLSIQYANGLIAMEFRILYFRKLLEGYIFIANLFFKYDIVKPSDMPEQKVLAYIHTLW